MSKILTIECGMFMCETNVKVQRIIPNLNKVVLLQKWGAIYYPKSLWLFKSEISPLHFTDFTLVKLLHYNITM